MKKKIRSMRMDTHKWKCHDIDMFVHTDTISNKSTFVSESSLETVLHRVIATEDRWAPTIARVALGLVMLPHGLQKTVGAFGGYGFSGTMGFFTETVGLPWIVALT